MSRRTLSPRRLHQIMYTMIYPAVLGSFLYAYWDRLANRGFCWNDPTAWLGGAFFIAVFTLDYVYSLEQDIQDHYSGPEFLADLVIVALIYLAAQALFGKPVKGLEGASPKFIWVYLFAIKFASTVWEIVRRSRAAAGSDASKPRRTIPRFEAMEGDAFFLVASLVLGVVAWQMPDGWSVLPLLAFLVADGLVYVQHTSDG